MGQSGNQPQETLQGLPTPYARETDFGSLAGSDTQTAGALNAELDAVGQRMTAITAMLRYVFRSDWQLRLFPGFTPAATDQLFQAAAVIQERVPSFDDFATVADALASGASRLLLTSIVTLTAPTDFGQVQIIDGGGQFVSADGLTHVIRKYVLAGDRQIFSQTGNFLVASKVNPCWWGAVSVATLPPTGAVRTAIARNNTIAFRKACKSMYADWAPNVTGPGAPFINFSVFVPPGTYLFTNGFSVPVGVALEGIGANSLLARYGSEFDPNEKAIPLVTAGVNYDANFNYVYDPNVGTAVAASAGVALPATAPYVRRLGFLDQQPGMAALNLDYPGFVANELFFTQCGVAIQVFGGGDGVVSDVIIDQGLTAIQLGYGCSGVVFENIICFNQSFGAITLAGGIVDVLFTNLIIQFPQQAGIYLAEGTGAIDNVRFVGGTFYMNSQGNANWGGMILSRAAGANIEFSGISFRNIQGPCIAQTLAAAVGGLRMVFTGCTFDGAKTHGGYNQSNTMQVMNLPAGLGEYIFQGCHFRNLFQKSVIGYGGVQLRVRQCTMGTQQYTGPIFSLQAGGQPGTNQSTFTFDGYNNGTNAWYELLVPATPYGTTVYDQRPIASLNGAGPDNTGALALTAAGVPLVGARAGNTEATVQDALNNSLTRGSATETKVGQLNVGGLVSVGAVTVRSPSTAPASAGVLAVLDPTGATNQHIWDGAGNQLSQGQIQVAILKSTGNTIVGGALAVTGGISGSSLKPAAIPVASLPPATANSGVYYSTTNVRNGNDGTGQPTQASGANYPGGLVRSDGTRWLNMAGAVALA